MKIATAEQLEPPSLAPEVPSSQTFREMADELQQCARREAFSLEALNFFALRDSSGIGLSTIAEVQRQCGAFYDMSVLLRALAPHEQFVRGIAARREEQ